VAKVGRDEADRELARLIRRSRALGAVQKRHWLRVLPHLSPLDRLRLRAILASELTPSEEPPST
jgi:hypothetical protein